MIGDSDFPQALAMSERLHMASGASGYGPRMIGCSKLPWMIRLYNLQELLLPGQFAETFLNSQKCLNTPFFIMIFGHEQAGTDQEKGQITEMLKRLILP